MKAFCSVKAQLCLPGWNRVPGHCLAIFLFMKTTTLPTAATTSQLPATGAAEARNANIELLRIGAMLYIVLYHLLIHAVVITRPFSVALRETLLSVLHVGVICFVLISGYWGIRFSLRGFLKLVVLCSFYSVLIYGTFALLHPAAFSAKQLLLAVLPIQWWYIPVYFCLYLLSPLLVAALRPATAAQKLVYIALLGLVSFGFGLVLPSLSDGKNPVNFCFIYCVGDFMRHHLPRTLSAGKLLLAYLLFNLGLLPLVELTNHSHLIKDILFHKLFFAYNGLGLLVNAGLFFLLFSYLNIKSRLINWVAASVLPVYLLHENEYLSPYLYQLVAALQRTEPSRVAFALYLLLFAAAIFLAAVAIDKILRPVINLLEKLVVNWPFIETLDSRLKNMLAERPK